MKRTFSNFIQLLFIISISFAVISCGSTDKNEGLNSSGVKKVNTKSFKATVKINSKDFRDADNFKVTNAVGIREVVNYSNDENVRMRHEYFAMYLANYDFTYGHIRASQPEKQGQYLLKMIFNGPRTPQNDPFQMIQPGTYKIVSDLNPKSDEMVCMVKLATYADEKTLFGFPFEAEGEIIIKENSDSIFAGAIALESRDGDVVADFSVKVGASAKIK